MQRLGGHSVNKGMRQAQSKGHAHPTRCKAATRRRENRAKRGHYGVNGRMKCTTVCRTGHVKYARGEVRQLWECESRMAAGWRAGRVRRDEETGLQTVRPSRANGLTQYLQRILFVTEIVTVGWVGGACYHRGWAG
jgi:hypothetical protein